MRGLFLDDERFPEDVKWIFIPSVEWDIVRNFYEFKDYILANGIPSVISFDNDLGYKQLEGRDCVLWMIREVMNGKLVIPDDFSYTVHSWNGVAKVWIEGYINNYLENQ